MIYVSASTVSIGVIKGIAISFSSFPFNISDATSTFTEPSVFEIIVVPLIAHDNRSREGNLAICSAFKV